MTADELRAALAALGFTQRGFAAYTGSNERTVRRWVAGDLDIAHWVPVVIRLLERERAGAGG
jgi:DNA-binding transcriptional regulator YiaG